MNGLLVFDYLNDVVFVNGEAAFTDYIVQRCIKEQLLGSEPDDPTSPEWMQEYHNALVQLFAPLVTSQRIMNSHFNNPYAAVHCEDGTIMAFSEHLGYSYVAIGIGRRNSESYLRRKLCNFIRMSTFLCGPTLNCLRSSIRGPEKQVLLGNLHDTWSTLHRSAFSFTVEAEERLLISQDLSAMCLKLMYESYDKLQGRVKDWTPAHMILLMNTKVLAMYSSKEAGELSESDILMLILFSCSLHPAPLTTCDKSETSIERSHSPQSSNSENSRFYSTRSSPVNPNEINHADDFRNPVILEQIEKSLQSLVREEEILSVTTADRTRGSLLQEVDPSTEVTEGLVDVYADFSSHLVYLQTPATTLLPHVICTVTITTGIILVIVFKTIKAQLSAGLVNSIKEVHLLLSTSNRDRIKQAIDSVERNLKSVTDSIKKSKFQVTAEMDSFLKRIQCRWNLLKKNGLLSYMRNKTDKHLPTSLECSLMQLSDNLKEGFQRLFVDKFNKNVFQTSIDNVIIDIQASLRYHLVDYIEYLEVKAMHNITMPTYYKDYPGLVHFIYVDRHSNQVTVPTTEDSTAVTSDGFSQKLILNKICKMVDMAWSHLEMGHLSFMWRDDCFVYSYFLWFEDMMGKPRKPERPLLTLVEDFPIPGVISDNFFKKLVKECFPSSFEEIHCYELFSVHSSDTEPSVVTKHAKELVSNVWETSGGARSLVDLL